MSYKIQLSNRTLRFLKKLDESTKKEILKISKNIGDDPSLNLLALVFNVQLIQCASCFEELVTITRVTQKQPQDEKAFKQPTQPL